MKRLTLAVPVAAAGTAEGQLGVVHGHGVRVVTEVTGLCPHCNTNHQSCNSHLTVVYTRLHHYY